MFSREYTFESKETRIKRIINSVLMMIFILLFIITSILLVIPYIAKNESLTSKEYFSVKSPDVIAVFTGDSGRIKEGIELSKKYPTAKFLISGVDSRNSFKTIINHQNLQENMQDLLKEQSPKVEIDYLARNTFENIISTIRFLKTDSTIQNVMIISSDYHILRIKLLLNALYKNESKVQFHYYSVSSDYTQWRNLKILLIELIKLMKALVLITFWDQDF